MLTSSLLSAFGALFLAASSQAVPTVGYSKYFEIPPINTPAKAVAFIAPDPTFNGTAVSGQVFLSQPSSDAETTIQVQLQGLTPGKHGFHIHEYGNIYPNCTAAGGHYNPFNQTHGAPDAQTRHVGDLGNVEAGQDGTVTVTLTDKLIKLMGPQNVVGRSFVVHANPDDLGLTDNPLSKTTGNAGGRVACGVIGIAKL